MMPPGAAEFFDELRLLVANLDDAKLEPEVSARLNEQAVDRLADEFEALYDSGNAIDLLDEELRIMTSRAPVADRAARIYIRARARMATRAAARAGEIQ